MNHVPSDPPVRLRDIAENLGVSQMTVSLALRNHPRISEKRRNQVREAALQMGYQPNAMASALAHRRWRTDAPNAHTGIAWLNHWPEPQRLRSFGEFDAYWQGAKEAAGRRGYRLEEFLWKQESPAVDLQEILLARGIRGIILPPHGGIELGWGDFAWNEFSIVRLGRSITQPAVHLIAASQAGDSMLAFAKMRERGYSRIGYVSSELFEQVTLFRAGFLNAQWTVEASLRLPMLMLSSTPDAKDADKMIAWIQDNQPDAILTSIGSLRKFLEQAGYQVPRDLALAGTSITDGEADAGIDQNPIQIGRAAVETLMSLMHYHERGIPECCREILVQGKWVDGSTCPDQLCGADPRPAA